MSKIEKMYMCKVCFELFTEEEAKQMNYMHNDHDFEYYDCDENNYLIPIDKPIAESIAKMNKKGWITQFCCSGHYVDTHTFSEFYVTFGLDTTDNLKALTFIPELICREPVGLEYAIERDCNADLIGSTNYRCRLSARNKDYSFSEAYSFNTDTPIGDKLLFDESAYEKWMGWRDRVYHKSFQEWVDALPDLNEVIFDSETNKYYANEDNSKPCKCNNRLREITSDIDEYLSMNIDKDYYRQGFIDICKKIRKSIMEALEIIIDNNKENAELVKNTKSMYDRLKEGCPISINGFNEIMVELNLNYFVESIRKGNRHIYYIRYKCD